MEKLGLELQHHNNLCGHIREDNNKGPLGVNGLDVWAWCAMVMEAI